MTTRIDSKWLREQILSNERFKRLLDNEPFKVSIELIDNMFVVKVNDKRLGVWADYDSALEAVRHEFRLRSTGV